MGRLIWNDLGCARLRWGVKSKKVLIGHWLQFSCYGLRVFMKGHLLAAIGRGPHRDELAYSKSETLKIPWQVDCPQFYKSLVLLETSFKRAYDLAKPYILSC